jgi:tRNA nucleotidyltransferase (CCA-adding enzyme)
VEQYVASLGLDAYLVGGAVRDELRGETSKDADFLVPGVDIAGLRGLLAPHGRVHDLIVAGRPVGVRLYPRDRAIGKLVPAGIEFAPPRRELSTGPGRHDFEIVVDATASVEDDLGRRDFTVNAMARHVAGGELVDPHGGRDDLERGVLRTVSPQSFAEDPLRLVRGLRFVSQLGLEPDDETLRQMREEAASVRLVSAERIGGGLAADGMGELSKLLLGAHPAQALRLARDTGVLVAIVPEYGPAIGFDTGGARQIGTVEEHLFAVVEAAPRRLAVRLAAFLHDLGKPGRGDDHAAAGARIANGVLERLRYPTELRRHVSALVAAHAFPVDGVDERFARRFLREHGDELAADLVELKAADLGAKHVPPGEIEAVARLRELVREQSSQPHRLSDLAVDGGDLLELGYRPGPALGDALDRLLEAVVDEPALNRRDTLLERARELLPR